MSIRKHAWMKVLVVLVIAASWLMSAAIAQQTKSKAPASRPAPQGAAPKTAPAKPAAAPAAVDPVDAAKKAAIMDSQRWRRAMFELNEWFSAQPFYDKKQVEQMKRNFSARVAIMSSSELEFMLEDMDAKFKIIDSKQAQEARDWLGNYLSMLSDWKREEVLKEMPNFTTMTAAQLSQEIAKIQRKRTLLSQQQAAFDRARGQQVEAQLQANRARQQAYIREQSRFSTSTYTSPYRAPTGGQPPFSDRRVGPDMEFYSGNFGQFGVIFNPSSY
jgi:Ni/Co efflux regulator RcnB